MLRNAPVRLLKYPTLESMTATLLRHCADDSATSQLGAELGRALRARGLPPLLIVLHGELGAGKTTLVRAALRELGVRGRIKSPSYALVEPYKLEKLDLELKRSVQITAYHIDLYRFSSSEEWLDAGLGDVLDGKSLCFVEWPEHARGLPTADLDIRVTPRGEAREVSLHSGSPAGEAVIDCLASAGAGAG
jgi:tRNA threonylcarbamoyladenosine biosynthesis protein TsaE